MYLMMRVQRRRVDIVKMKRLLNHFFRLSPAEEGGS